MKTTPLTQLHEAAGGKIVEFAGYAMPIQYKDGILKEHQWVRESAGIFDVSHMGQLILKGKNSAALLSTITPSNIRDLPVGKAKYTVLTNPGGGIIDDLIITRLGEESFYIVINAACKDKDIPWITQNLLPEQTLEEFPDRALIALQGPKAVAVLAALVKEEITVQYMSATTMTLKSGVQVMVGRTGYTGEDGFEISIPGQFAADLWNDLLKNPAVKAIGLGARDSLRLEMGYPLYGHDLNDQTSPVEAGLAWVIDKTASNYIGAERICRELKDGAARRRVGIVLKERGVAREGMSVLATDGKKIGELTSGGFAPSLQASIGMAYVPPEYAAAATSLKIDIRGNMVAAEIIKMPFKPAATKKAA